MPYMVNVGLSKKVGLPNYGSLGASCCVQVEFDPLLFQEDLAALQQKIRQAYAACHDAIQHELQTYEAISHPPAPPPGQAVSAPTTASATMDAACEPPGQGHGQRADHVRRATTNQVRAIEAIARRQGVDLVELLEYRYQMHQASELSFTDASHLIDELKSVDRVCGAA